ncbi:RNA-processing protein [Candidatus Woesearchaeota archaeon]|nr:MAG: RNA-processing protein [Candidatus Woesearchaeota archaeon]
MEEYSYELKIPKERIAVLIGKKGEVKKEIEDATDTKLEIDSKEGDVTIHGKDSLKIFDTKLIIQAIGRGFNPDVAMQLLKIDNTFELIDISEYAKTKKALIRLRGRIIGKGGRSRANLERLTDTSICIYGKTAGIIGRAEDVLTARKAVESLLKGSPHSVVYKWLEKQHMKKIIGET